MKSLTIWSRWAGFEIDGSDGSYNSLVVDLAIPTHPVQPDGKPFVPANAGDFDSDGDLDLFAGLDDAAVDAAAPSNTSSIDNHDALAVPLEHGVNGIPGRPRLVRYDDALLAQYGVEQHGFAHVGPPYNSHLHQGRQGWVNEIALHLGDGTGRNAHQPGQFSLGQPPPEPEFLEAQPQVDPAAGPLVIVKNYGQVFGPIIMRFVKFCRAAVFRFQDGEGRGAAFYR